jgi:hypothetical protein
MNSAASQMPLLTLLTAVATTKLTDDLDSVAEKVWSYWSHSIILHPICMDPEGVGPD